MAPTPPTSPREEPSLEMVPKDRLLAQLTKSQFACGEATTEQTHRGGGVDRGQGWSSSILWPPCGSDCTRADRGHLQALDRLARGHSTGTPLTM